MAGRVAGKRICITTGSGTLAAPVAAAFLAEGASVLLADLDSERARVTATSLGNNAVGVQLNMRSAESRTRFVAELGERGIDVLINHASVIVVRPFLELSEQDLDEAFDINVKAMTLTMVAVAKDMVQRSIRGSIINRLGQLGATTRSRGAALTAAFNATNAAMTSVTRSAALALAEHGIRVNGIAPGPIRMPMWEDLDAALGLAGGVSPGNTIARVQAAVPLDRFGEPADLVGAMLFLGSDESSFVTGQIIDVDGGHGLA